jgi:lysophospholipase L1-like esterase
MTHQDAATKWVVSWAASVQGPYPIGNPSAQPDQQFAFPRPDKGARDQTLRLVLRPTIWGNKTRIRLSNVFGNRPVTFGGIYVGLQLGGAALVKGSNRPVTFAGKHSVTVAAGASAWSDPVALPFVQHPDALTGRKLAVSLHCAGDTGPMTGPMTWHAKALQTSFASPPGSGSLGERDDEAGFPFSVASWFFLDALEMAMPAASSAIVAFGDSISDGTFSTMNGDDRWPDVLSRRLHAAHGNRIAVINAGIGGNQVAGPEVYTWDQPYPGGPSAKSRIDRDVLALSGVSHMIWLEGANDFSHAGNASFETVRDAMTETVAHVRKLAPHIKLIGATVVTALGSTRDGHGSVEQDRKRRALNDFIRTSALFDGVIDFDAVTIDRATGRLKPEFVPDGTVGGPGDGLHPNRAGYLAMGMAVDLGLFK